MTLQGKVAIVTGGTKGIGFAITEALCREGAAVMICARSGNRVESAVANMKSQVDNRITGIKCDVQDHRQVKWLIKATVEEFGGLDILVNNAGVVNLGSVEELTAEDWRQVIDTNLTGVFYCCHEAIPEMKRRGGGYIINLASRSGKNAFAGGAAYNASKFGLIGFSEALMLDVRHDHIRVSYVMPGRVSTELAGERPETWQLAPEDIARAVVDLLSYDPRAVATCVEIRPSEPPVY